MLGSNPWALRMQGISHFANFFFSMHEYRYDSWAQTEDLDRVHMISWLRPWIHYSLLHRPNINLRPDGIIPGGQKCMR